jgi:threonine dehydrogenase-like Zn-dependent dehydrogenase
MTTLQHRSYWVIGPGQGELREHREQVNGHPVLRAAYSGISSGTERLVGRGQVPAALSAEMACRGMEGTFPHPVKYGYSWVGLRSDGQAVFTMHPHQDLIQVPAEHTVRIPPSIPLPRATLLPNLETALNAWWDAEDGAKAPFLIVGGGIVGVLLAFVGWHHTGQRARVVEIDADRREALSTVPWLEPITAEAVGEDRMATIFHTSASGEGLQWSIDHLGFEGRVIELSWYGERPVSLHLGTSFHYERKLIIASQVATVARPKRGPGDFQKRIDAVLELLSEPSLDTLPGPFIPFEELPTAMRRLYAGEHLGFHPVVTYHSAR